MDKASAYGAGDCRFESCRGHMFVILVSAICMMQLISRLSVHGLSYGFLNVQNLLDTKFSCAKVCDMASYLFIICLYKDYHCNDGCFHRYVMMPCMSEIVSHAIFIVNSCQHCIINRPRGPMDKASAYGAGDCRFESCRGHLPASLSPSSRD